MKLRLLSFVLAIPFLLLAQTPLLSLNSGDYLLPEGIQSEAFIQSHDGIHYGLLQVHKIPSNTEKRALSSLGFKFLGYLPENTYVVSFPEMIPFQALDNVDWIRSLMPHSPDHKLEAALAVGNFPSHALITPEIIQLNLEFYKGVDPKTAIKALLDAGLRDLEYQKHSNSVEVVWSTEQMSKLAQFPFVSFISPISPPMVPDNLPGKTLSRSSSIKTNYSGGLNYDGTGIIIALNDDGSIGPHIDYQGRIDQQYVVGNSGDHGDHVGGTIAGAGNIDPTAEGMAPGAFMYVYNAWDGVTDIDNYYFNPGIRITSTSYSNGCNAGYTVLARAVDEDIYTLPALMHVWSAGNSGTQNCGYGAGSGWGNITGGIKIGKNVTVVGNMTSTGGLAASSSRGPAEDGRIKPDICAVGTDVNSTIDPNSYGLKTGTSMSCPAISGITAQLYQAYKENNGGQEPDGGFIKSLMLNTAEDKGNVGPDFKYGWGRVNARKAAIEIENATSMIDSVANGGTQTHTITVAPGAKELKVMVYWTDKEATVGASNVLVNDLNISLSDGTTTYMPWLLDHTPNATALNTPATTGIDDRNNVEQVAITAPAAGTYTLTVSGFNVPFGPQKYYVHVYQEVDEIVVTYPIGGEAFNPLVNELIRWDAPEDAAAFTFEYSEDGGATWLGATTIPANRLYYNWNIPNAIVSDQALVRISRGSQSDVSDAPFNIAQVPSGLTLDYACPDSMQFSFNTVPGITNYEIDFLGTMYMDSVGAGTGTSGTIMVYNRNPTLNSWATIRSIFPSGVKGRRAYAKKILAGTQNCVLAEDLEIVSILSPTGGLSADCLASGASDIVIEVTNNGQDTVSGVSFSHQYDAGAVVTEPYAPSIAPGASFQFTFANQLTITGSGTHNLTVWSNLAADGDPYNDTVKSVYEVYSTGLPTQAVPYTEDFTNFIQCGTASDCEGTVCALTDGWKNFDNGSFDEIDWRPRSGGTPSTGTGPTGDHTTGSGKYLYLEASGPCIYKTAVAATPCIDLNTAGVPELKFWYHMVGTAMGDLYVDIKAGSVVYSNVWQQSGQNAAGWTQVTLSLLPFATDTIQVLFRAETGNDWSSDIAIDDIQIVNNTAPPVAQFTVENPLTCLNGQADVTDNSSGTNAWSWTITPAGFHTFLNGTSANSQDISLSFSATGIYDVKLVATNPFGSDSITQTAAIEVTDGILLQHSQDFQSAAPFAPWTIDNPDAAITWVNTQINVGPTGTPSNVAFMDHYSYTAMTEEDHMLSPFLDLTSETSAMLTFDVSYSGFSASNPDELKIEVSTDCGASFMSTGYHKIGTALATAPPTTSNWLPGSASDWRSDTVDLSPFVGSTILVRFTSVNGYGNGMYIDNINIFKPTNITSTITAAAGCENQPIAIEDNTGVGNLGWNWDFGSFATPATATGAGPHNVTFSTVGPHVISLLTWDATDTINLSSTISLDALPTAGFTIAQGTPGQVLLTNTSVDGTTYSWTFGDGNGSSDPDPTHMYAANGIYTITLVANNACGQDIISQTVNVNNVSIEEILNSFKVYPNPVLTALTIEGNDAFTYAIYDLAGALIADGASMGTGRTSVDLQSLPQAVYLLEIYLEGETRRERIVKTE